jgi:hypothetical protein
MTQELLGRVHRELLDVLNSINQDKIHHDGDDFHELLNDVEKALAEHAMQEVQRLGQEIEQEEVQRLGQEIEQEPCDMGEVCLGCSPRSADGSCPDAKPSGACDCYKEGFRDGMNEFKECYEEQPPKPEQEPMEVDQATMELAESVGLIGPTSRTHDLHQAIQRFHDLICVNATVKAAQMAADVIRESTQPQRKPLTAEQLELLWDEAVDRMEHFCSQYWDFARAIEAAHGIKE